MSTRTDLVFTDVSDLLHLATGYRAASRATTYSIGDTHGNAMGLIRYYYEAGIINITAAEYAELLQIYTVDTVLTRSGSRGMLTSALTAAQCDRFRAIVRQGLRQSVVPPDVRLRNFGDMLADRGANDALSLIVLDEVQQQFPALTRIILMSNHDKSFISNFLRGNLRPGAQLDLEVHPCFSLLRFKHLIDTGVIDYAEVERMVNTAYLPSLKLIDYVRTGTTVDIMSHAPLSLAAIDNAMRVFLPADRQLDIYASADNLTSVLDSLNIAFQAGLQDPTSAMYAAITSAPGSTNPLQDFIWTRLRDISSAPAPTITPNYSVRFRHGHDGVPGTQIIHGISYQGYNNILGQMPQPSGSMGWDPAAAASLTASASPGDTWAALMAAGVDNVPTTMVARDAGDVAIAATRSEAAASSAAAAAAAAAIASGAGTTAALGEASAARHAQEAFTKCQNDALRALDAYIVRRGSYFTGETGDRFWTAAVASGNGLRRLFHLTTADVPQAKSALELKRAIQGLTISNFSQNWPSIETMIREASTLGHSGEYRTVVDAIASSFAREQSTFESRYPRMRI